MTNLSLPVMMVKQPTKPVRTRAPFAVEVPDVELLCSRLPRTDGHGLTTAEWMKVNGRANRVKADVARDMPEATPGELHAIGERAAVDALREVLRARPVACCDSLEERPCMGCSDALADDVVSTDVIPSIDPWDVECDPADWPADTDAFVWEPDDAPAFTLAEMVEFTASRFRSLDNGFGDLVSDRLAELVRDIYSTSAIVPDQVEARLSVLERDFTEPVEFDYELNSAGRWA